MQVVVMTGDHPRHRAFARVVDSADALSGVIVERREDHVPEPPADLDAELAELFETHFRRRREAELRFFGSDEEFPSVPIHRVESDELNSDHVVDWIRDVDPDLVLTYGIGILDSETIKSIPAEIWNVHAGLSPEYRGVITHFWPSYRLEPQMTGVTLHVLTPDLDAGPVVHQTGAALERGDGLHDLASRSVQSFFEELPEVLERFRQGTFTDPVNQSKSGKLWTSEDWRPEHLRLIYDVYDDSIVDHYLDGDFGVREPDLIRQF